MNRLMWICMAAVVVACGPTPEGICEKINDECDDIESLDCEDFAEFYDDQYDDGSEGEREDLDDMLACADEKDSCDDLGECVIPLVALQACETMIDKCDEWFAQSDVAIDCERVVEDTEDLSDSDKEDAFENIACILDGKDCEAIVGQCMQAQE